MGFSLEHPFHLWLTGQGLCELFNLPIKHGLFGGVVGIVGVVGVFEDYISQLSQLSQLRLRRLMPQRLQYIMHI